MLLVWWGGNVNANDDDNAADGGGHGHGHGDDDSILVVSLFCPQVKAAGYHSVSYSLDLTAKTGKYIVKQSVSCCYSFTVLSAIVSVCSFCGS